MRPRCGRTKPARRPDGRRGRTRLEPGCDCGRSAMQLALAPDTTLPIDGVAGTLIGRVWLPDVDGPCVVVLKSDGVHDITGTFATVRDLCETRNPAQAAGAAPSQPIGT